MPSLDDTLLATPANDPVEATFDLDTEVRRVPSVHQL